MDQAWIQIHFTLGKGVLLTFPGFYDQEQDYGERGQFK